MDFLQLQTFTVVSFFAVLTIIGQILAFILVVALLLEIYASRSSRLIAFVKRHGLLLMLIVALAATVGSLFFSEIAQWTPCKACWYQRIFMYPQVVLLGIALWKRDTKIALYILVLSVIGMGFAIDHYAEQVMAAYQPADATQPCDATGVSCAKTQIHFAFGYITIPMMAIAAFLLNTVGSIVLLRSKERI